MQELGLIKSSPERSNYLKAWSASFSQSTECLIPDFHPELLSGALKVGSCSGHDLIFVDVDGKCQFVADTYDMDYPKWPLTSRLQGEFLAPVSYDKIV